MRQSGRFVLLILLGWGFAQWVSVDVDSVAGSPAYTSAIYLLLAVGTLGATSGLDLREARRDRRIIILAVTLGVAVKALLIGGLLALLWLDPLFLLLGVVVAQIDPIWAAGLAADDRLSPRARSVLTAWACFDSPITVILSIYAAAVAVDVYGVGTAPPTGVDPVFSGVANLAGNVLLAAVTWVLWRIVMGRQIWQLLVLVVSLAAAVATGWVLAIALIGLFARPERLRRVLPPATAIALVLASILLGMLMVDGVDLIPGILLGVMAFLAQMVVSPPLTRGMPRADRWHIAAAQQNGITAIVLALSLEFQFEGVVAIVAPAIVTANLLHVITNRFIDTLARR